MNIYILKCIESKYYVGKTINLDRRLEEHFSGYGCEWTNKYPPIELVENFEKADKYDEDKYVLKYMERYGIDNVRGGCWSTISIVPEERKMLEKRINSAEDRCHNCGDNGHFIRDCSRVDHHTEHVTEKLYVRDTLFSYGSCFRCGRKSHYSNMCYAKTDINGRYL